MYSISLEEQPQGPLEEIAEDLAEVLGVKVNTAMQIVSHTPLIVFNNLNEENAHVLFYALNEAVPVLNWQLKTTVDDQLPAVNWNKLPTINGKTLTELSKATALAKASAQITCPHCQKIIALHVSIPTAQQTQRESVPAPAPHKASPAVESKPLVRPRVSANFQPAAPLKSTTTSDIDTDSTIIKTADSVIMRLSEDLEKSFGMQEFNPASTTQDGARAIKQKMPGDKNSLNPGLYQLFLPPLKKKNQQALASQLCMELLGWSEDETREALKKRFICVARDINHIDGSKMMDVFEEKGIKLTSKKIASI